MAKGEFQYRINLEDTAILILMFPNASELPVFAEPGAEVEIEGDASHLKEVKVTGTQDNKLMTSFRLHLGKMKTPPEVYNAATNFIKENPTSLASRYILDRYLVRADGGNCRCRVGRENAEHPARNCAPLRVVHG